MKCGALYLFFLYWCCFWENNILKMYKVAENMSETILQVMQMLSVTVKFCSPVVFGNI